eukprot:TRINITY_DN40717_c0_g1_i1.p1 TRINITY_DN40717_c0_g1~~TRINITY_DN40717_c0_g1_i1.p1  ORF type:complete len:2945 (-),score=449.91 TRINITY_DN40717_c0_g1_i1:115-8949(-)
MATTCPGVICLVGLLVHLAASEPEVCWQQRQANAWTEPGKAWPGCGQKWALTNTAVVRDFWDVFEAQLFWDVDCTDRLADRDGIAFSYPERAHIAYSENDARKAFDEQTDTAWSSDCRLVLGGCAPSSVFIGVELKEKHWTTQPTPDDQDLSSVLFPAVRCFRVWQSTHILHKAEEVGIAVYSGVGGRDDSFEVIQTFDGMTGGGWQMRPMKYYGQHRLWNIAPTVEPWEVAEIRFYSDAFCRDELQGLPAASSQYVPPDICEDRVRPGGDCNEFSPEKAFDGHAFRGNLPEPLPTRWKAGCSIWSGCPKNSHWIGLDMSDNPLPVYCMRIFQLEPEPDRPPTYSPDLVLKTFKGFKGLPGTWSNVANFTGMRAGIWEHTMPISGAAWRLIAQSNPEMPWEVADVEFHSTPDCGGSVGRPADALGASDGAFRGLPITSSNALPFQEQDAICSSNSAVGDCADFAFDGLPLTTWKSSCTTCRPPQVWVGLLSWLPHAVAFEEVSCFRLLQGHDARSTAIGVELSEWTGEDWRTRRNEDGLGGGSWQRRPVGPGAAYRLLGFADTAKPWTVLGLEMFDNAACQGDRWEASPIASCSDYRHPAAGVALTEREAFWVASCGADLGSRDPNDAASIFDPPPVSTGCQKGEAWLGLQGMDAPEIRCLRLRQHRHRERRMWQVVLQRWQGIKWEPFYDMNQGWVLGLGGGDWQTWPSQPGALWRLALRPQQGALGMAVAELGLYTSATCENASRILGRAMASAVASAPEIVRQTGYTAHLREVGTSSSVLAAPELVFDGKSQTFWAELMPIGQPETMQEDGNEAWVGLELDQPGADVLCARILLSDVPSMQPSWAELQTWDGRGWVSRPSTPGFRKDMMYFWAENRRLPVLPGSGWLRRPAVRDALWRVENGESLVDGWAVAELRFHEDTSCADPPVNGTPLASLPVVPYQNGQVSGQHLPSLAFDGVESTSWYASCGAQPEKCAAGLAWIGLDAVTPHRVRCVRLLQAGHRDLRVGSVVLSFWTGANWEAAATYGGLGGGAWQTRPALPNSLWRIVFVEGLLGQQRPGMAAAAAAADGGAAGVSSYARPNENSSELRAWGVSEIELFSDDGCMAAIPLPADGANVVSSGVFEVLDPSSMDLLKATSKATNAFDGQAHTYWAADCGLRGIGLNDREAPASKKASQCMAEGEWIGIDFRALGTSPVSVKCLRMSQPLRPTRTCCNPATRVRLERWNGTTWRPAISVHHPKEPERDLRLVDGMFANMTDSGQASASQEFVFEALRDRRQSERCLVWRPAVARHFQRPQCSLHKHCVAAGFKGLCCPLALGSGAAAEEKSMHRCCCDPLVRTALFEDELPIGMDRQPLPRTPLVGPELILLRSSTVLPAIGLALALGVCLAASIGRPSCGGALGEALRWIWVHSCRALQRRLRKVREWDLGVCHATAYLLLWRPKDSGLRMARALALLVACLIFGPVILFIGLAYAAGGAVAWLVEVVFTRQLLRARCAYELSDPDDMKLLQKITSISSSRAESSKLGTCAMNVGCGVGMCVFDFVKLSVDVLLVRLAVDSLGVNQPYSASAFESVEKLLPQGLSAGVGMEQFQDGLESVLRVGLDFLKAAYLALGSGDVPQCQGPVRIFSGLFALIVGFLIAGWLSSDPVARFFGARVSIRKTQPLFHRAFMQTTMCLGQSVVVLFLQCIALLYARGLWIGDGIHLSSEEEFWHCPHGAREVSRIIGTMLMWIGAVVGGLAPVLRCDRPNTGSLAMLVPRVCLTTLGIWSDSVNVKGCEIPERAQRTAEEMRLPVLCGRCGKRHVPHERLMSATALQLSLVYQVFPLGVLVGKLCERFNDPPLYYKSCQSVCCGQVTYGALVDEYGPKWAEVRCVAKMCAFVIDAVPPLCRCADVVACLLMWLVAATSTAGPAGPSTAWSIRAGLYVSLARSVLKHLFLPAAVWILYSVLRETNEEVAEVGAGEESDMAKRRQLSRHRCALVAEAVLGTCCGGLSAAALLVSEDRESSTASAEWREDVLLGSCILGASLGIAHVAVAVALRNLCHGLLGIFALAVLSLMTSISLALLLGLCLQASVSAMVFLSLLVALVLMPTALLALGADVAPVHPILGLRRAEGLPACWPLVSRARRLLPGPLGIALGTSVCTMSLSSQVGAFGGINGSLLACAVGSLVAVVAAVLADEFSDCTPGSVAVATAFIVYLTLLWPLGVPVSALLSLVAAFFAGMCSEARLKYVLCEMSWASPDTFMEYMKTAMETGSVAIGDPSSPLASDEDKHRFAVDYPFHDEGEGNPHDFSGISSISGKGSAADIFDSDLLGKRVSLEHAAKSTQGLVDKAESLPLPQPDAEPEPPAPPGLQPALPPPPASPPPALRHEDSWRRTSKRDSSYMQQGGQRLRPTSASSVRFQLPAQENRQAFSPQPAQPAQPARRPASAGALQRRQHSNDSAKAFSPQPAQQAQPARRPASAGALQRRQPSKEATSQAAPRQLRRPTSAGALLLEGSDVMQPAPPRPEPAPSTPPPPDQGHYPSHSSPPGQVARPTRPTSATSSVFSVPSQSESPPAWPMMRLRPGRPLSASAATRTMSDFQSSPEQNSRPVRRPQSAGAIGRQDHSVASADRDAGEQMNSQAEEEGRWWISQRRQQDSTISSCPQSVGSDEPHTASPPLPQESHRSTEEPNEQLLRQERDWSLMRQHLQEERQLRQSRREEKHRAMQTYIERHQKLVEVEDTRTPSPETPSRWRNRPRSAGASAQGRRDTDQSAGQLTRHQMAVAAQRRAEMQMSPPDANAYTPDPRSSTPPHRPQSASAASRHSGTPQARVSIGSPLLEQARSRTRSMERPQSAVAGERTQSAGGVGRSSSTSMQSQRMSTSSASKQERPSSAARAGNRNSLREDILTPHIQTYSRPTTPKPGGRRIPARSAFQTELSKERCLHISLAAGEPTAGFSAS